MKHLIKYSIFESILPTPGVVFDPTKIYWGDLHKLKIKK